MMDRKYSIEEIDRMRQAIGNMYPSGCSYMPAERAADTENRLRTYMQNGTDPKELEAASSEYMNREFAAQERRQKMYSWVGKP